MREYYKEKLSNLREVFRSVVLFFIALTSGIGAMIYNLLKGFTFKIFVLFSFSFINEIILFLILIKLYKILNEMTEKLRE